MSSASTRLLLPAELEDGQWCESDMSRLKTIYAIFLKIFNIN